MCLSLSFHNYKVLFFLKSETLILFKLNKFSCNRKEEPGDHESSLKIFISKLSLARCPCALSEIFFILKTYFIVNIFIPKHFLLLSNRYFFVFLIFKFCRQGGDKYGTETSCKEKFRKEKFRKEIFQTGFMVAGSGFLSY